MRKILVGLMIFTILLTVACEEPTDEEIFYKMQKKLSKMESYSTIANITVVGNKSEKTYKLRHIFKRPNRYIIQVIEPEESGGCITVYDGKQAWIYHPQINQSMLIKDFKGSAEQNIFIGYFLKLFVTNEDIRISAENIKDAQYLTLTADIPGNNKYRYKEKLWVDKETFTPYQLIIYDKDGKASVKVKYSNFKHNVDIKDEEFNIEATKKILNNI
ncbi:LolA family protein [Caldisalinibacter kiritimatiensis]|uniref:Putative outer membrane lipoprotein-sorting protein n=1 Tax=Caldisalinibacter kiritimatiensis TaxID=1304284 RepID=R1ASA9_9FIRM|nr:outer-membrane lipoprotein carrier protein LolA [Caldisalinibacter kiritimatiensis]EOC99531.1 Putative outer membrane lipoprotein-sorting protein [Caldisalinibacter kiritimatiensis]